MARIKIDDLPALKPMDEEELRKLHGGADSLTTRDSSRDDVNVVIDPGAVFKLHDANLDAG